MWQLKFSEIWNSNAVFYTTFLHIFTYLNIHKQCGKVLSSLVLSFATCIEWCKYRNIVGSCPGLGRKKYPCTPRLKMQYFRCAMIAHHLAFMRVIGCKFKETTRLFKNAAKSSINWSNAQVFLECRQVHITQNQLYVA